MHLEQYTCPKIWTKWSLINNKKYCSQRTYHSNPTKTNKTKKSNNSNLYVEHQKEHNMEVQGNRMTDEAAKKAALQSEAPFFSILPWSFLLLPLPWCIVFKKKSDYQNWELPKFLMEYGFYPLAKKNAHQINNDKKSLIYIKKVTGGLRLYMMYDYIP
jgi:hypothetical protein